MKWFKHYTDASRSEKLSALRELTGVEGYGRYWLLVEFLAEKFDGNCTEFIVNKKTLGRHLGYYRPTMARHWLDIGHTLGLFQVSLSGQCPVNDDLNYFIVFPKLVEIKDNHTKNLQVTNKLVPPREEKKRIEKKRVTKTKCEFDLNLIYAEYPKKAGKALGFKKLEKLITSTEIFNSVLQGAKNYSDLCLDNNTDPKYIKQFSTWCNGEHWNDQFETKSMVEKELKDLEQKLYDKWTAEDAGNSSDPMLVAKDL